MTLRQTLCLCMIVKNEAHVIVRCLASVRPIIGHWLIVDTGSTDGTQAVIRAAMADLPGALVERPWVDFAHNRSEALVLARPHGDYSLIIDADDELVIPPGFAMPVLDADSCTLDIDYNGTVYQRPQLVRNSLAWRYRGVLHEFLDCAAAETSTHLPIRVRVHREGGRSTDPQTYVRDAAVLRRALETEADPFLIARYTFYLAQSYRDCGRREEALDAYLRRTRLGFWIDEVYVSFYQAGKLMESLGRDPDLVIATYARASEVLPTRAEAAHAASRFCRFQSRNRQGFAVAKLAFGLPAPLAGLFVETWIYDYGLCDELAINAFWAGEYRDCVDACLRALEGGKVPEQDKPRLLGNMRFALDKLPAGAAEIRPDPPRPTANLGSRGDVGFLDQFSLQTPRPLRSITSAPKVLIAILVRDMDVSLPLFLDCLEALDYPKSRIALHIRTNNNTDGTEALLRAWTERAGAAYAHVELDADDVSERVQDPVTEKWTTMRLQVLGRIRETSLRRTLALGCDYYLTIDADNFIRPCTLRELVATRLPIVSPFLRSLVRDELYSNYHAEIDPSGYYAECDQYHWIVHRWIVGLIEVPVVHCTYLVRADVIPLLSYLGDMTRNEYVLFSESARRNDVGQYLDNRQVYGYLARHDLKAHTDRARDLLRAELGRQAAAEPTAPP